MGNGDTNVPYRLTFVIGESAVRRLTGQRCSPISFCYAILLNAD